MSDRSVSGFGKNLSANSLVFSLWVVAVGGSPSVRPRFGSLTISWGPWLRSRAHLSNIHIFLLSLDASVMTLRQHLVRAARTALCCSLSASLWHSQLASDLTAIHLRLAHWASQTASATIASHHSSDLPLPCFLQGTASSTSSHSCWIRSSTAHSRSSGVDRSVVSQRQAASFFTLSLSIPFQLHPSGPLSPAVSIPFSICMTCAEWSDPVYPGSPSYVTRSPCEAQARSIIESSCPCRRRVGSPQGVTSRSCHLTARSSSTSEPASVLPSQSHSGCLRLKSPTRTISPRLVSDQKAWIGVLHAVPLCCCCSTYTETTVTGSWPPTPRNVMLHQSLPVLLVQSPRA